MALKTIEYTVTSEGITPKTEQSGGTQGEHNATEVLIALGADLPSGTHYRVQAVDGAGGFYSSELLTPNKDGKISFLLCEDITKPGGVAYLHLVVTEVTYDANGKYVNENQTFLSKPMRLRFENSGIGSPSEEAYRLGITGALLSAQQSAEQAEDAKEGAETAKIAADEAKTLAQQAATTARTMSIDANKAAENAKTSQESAGKAAGAAKISAQDAQADAQTALKAVEEVKQIKGQVAELKQDVDAAAERASVSEVSASQAASAATGSADFAGEQARIAKDEVAWVRENIGDMSEALKEIIALQEMYIGGND